MADSGFDRALFAIAIAETEIECGVRRLFALFINLGLLNHKIIST
jgi:hypothetical protein